VRGKHSALRATATQRTQYLAATRPSGFGGAIARGLAVLALAAAGAGAVALGTSQARAAPVSSFGDLMESGYTAQPINNYAHGNFAVEGAVPALDYYFGFLDENGFVVGHLDSYPGYPYLVSGNYNGDPSVPGYSNVLNVGEKPYNAIVIEDTDADNIIGDLTGGTFTVDAGDRMWLTNDIEFNGARGAISEMPAYTGTSDTLTIPSVNLVPEPMTVGFMAVGALAVLARKRAAGPAVRGAGKKP